MEQNPSIENIQNPSVENVQNPSVENVQNPSVENVKYPVVNKKVFISPPAINCSFNQELRKEPGSVNLTECVTCNVCKSIYQNVSKVRLHQATDHLHLSVYCDDDGCPFIFKTKCGMTKHFKKKHLKILNNVNSNSDQTSVHVSGDSGNNTSEVVNLSCDQNNSGDPLNVVIKTEKSSVSHVLPKKRDRPKDVKKENQ